MMLLALVYQLTLIEALLAWRDIQCWILVKKVDWLEMNLEDFARHDGKILLTSQLLVTTKAVVRSIVTSTRGMWLMPTWI